MKWTPARISFVAMNGLVGLASISLSVFLSYLVATFKPQGDITDLGVYFGMALVIFFFIVSIPPFVFTIIGIRTGNPQTATIIAITAFLLACLGAVLMTGATYGRGGPAIVVILGVVALAYMMSSLCYFAEAERIKREQDPIESGSTTQTTQETNQQGQDVNDEAPRRTR